MAKERLKPVNIAQIPELLRLAEEVHKSRRPRVLRRDHEDLAVLIPAPPARRSPSKARPVTEDDPLFRLIGIGETNVPGGLSEKKHEYLARAYTPPE